MRLLVTLNDSTSELRSHIVREGLPLSDMFTPINGLLEGYSWFTAPLRIAMATTAWESTAACLGAAQHSTLPADASHTHTHTPLYVFPGKQLVSLHAGRPSHLAVVKKEARSGTGCGINTL